MDDNSTGSPDFRRPYYEAVWRGVLRVILRWPEDRVKRFIELSDDDLDDRGNIWFYHDDALDYVANYLVPFHLRQQNTFDFGQFNHAIGRVIGFHPPFERPLEFDWESARQRVQSFLADHDASLPEADDIPDFLRARLGEDCP